MDRDDLYNVYNKMDQIIYNQEEIKKQQSGNQDVGGDGKSGIVIMVLLFFLMALSSSFAGLMAFVAERWSPLLVIVILLIGAMADTAISIFIIVKIVKCIQAKRK